MAGSTTTNNVTTQELEIALGQLLEQMGLSVKEYVEGGFLDLTTYGTDKAAILARLDSIDKIDAEDGIESLAEKIAAINEVLSNDEGALQGILDLIEDNQEAISAEVATRTELTDQLRNDVDAVTSLANTNASTISALSTGQASLTEDLGGLEDRVTANEGTISTLTGDDTVEGSVAKTVKDAVQAEEDRTKSVIGLRADLITEEKGNIVSAINEVQQLAYSAQESANFNGMDIFDLQEKIGDFVPVDSSDNPELAYIDNSGGEAGNLTDQVKKLAAETLGADQALASRLDTVEDVTEALQPDVASNKAAIETLTGDENTLGSVAKTVKDARDDLQEQIDAITGGGTGSIGDLADRVTDNEEAIGDIEDILNDTIDEDDNLVKGLKTRVTEAEQAIADNAASTQEALSQLEDDLKAYSDARDLKAASMDLCSLNNIFRGALGLVANSCDGSGDGEGSGEVGEGSGL